MREFAVRVWVCTTPCRRVWSDLENWTQAGHLLGEGRVEGYVLDAHLMKVVFPVEYWPITSTMGLLSKSASW